MSQLEWETVDDGKAREVHGCGQLRQIGSGVFPTSIMKHATQHRSPTRSKVEQLGTKIFCLRVWFLNLAIWTCKWHAISECEFPNGTRTTCDRQPFGIPLYHPMLKHYQLGFSFLFFFPFATLSPQRESKADTFGMPLSLSSDRRDWLGVLALIGLLREQSDYPWRNPNLLNTHVESTWSEAWQRNTVLRTRCRIHFMGGANCRSPAQWLA